MILTELQRVAARSVAFIGLAKNAGKTTAMNRLIAELDRAAERFGVMSVGVDGESHDIISGLAKPAIRVRCDTLVATARDALSARDLACEILVTTGISTPLGELVVARVTSPGEVLLAGVRYRADAIRLRSEMHALGAERVLIDGAFDRFASADPALSDALVIATGASVAEALDQVVARTAGFLRRMRLPIDVCPESLERLSSVVLGPSGARAVGSAAGPRFGARLRAAWRPDDIGVAVPRLVSDRTLEAIRELTPPGTVVWASDPSRIVGSDAELERFLRRRELRVERSADIAAVTVNPWRSDGRSEDALALLSAVGRAVGGLPALDIQADRRYVAPS